MHCKIFLQIIDGLKKSLRTTSKEQWPNEMLCAIWYHFYNLNNVKSTHGGVLLLVKLQFETFNFTKSKTAPWVFFTLFRLYKYHINTQSITNIFYDISWKIVVGAHIFQICLFEYDSFIYISNSTFRNFVFWCHSTKIGI